MVFTQRNLAFSPNPLVPCWFSPGAHWTHINSSPSCTATYVSMICALGVSFLIASFIANIGIAQEVIDDGADDIIVFPGGEDIEAINDIIEDLVNSEELESSTSPTNISVTSKAPLFKTIG